MFFIAIYLLSATQLSELLKLPLLAEHYLEHKKENKDLTFIGFLENHYKQGVSIDADYDKDMKLPFKKCNSSVFVTTYFCSFNSNPEISLSFVSEVTENKISDYNFIYSSVFLASIWQPPKNC